MNCDGVRDLLSAYLDGELSPGELLRVEQHLRRCHACADEVDSLRQTMSLVASLEEVEVPAAFHAQLHQRLVALGPPMAAANRIRRAPSRQHNVRRWTVPASAAAAVAALAIGFSVYSGGGVGPGLASNPSVMKAENQVAVGPSPEQTGGKQSVQPPMDTTPPSVQPPQTVEPPKTGTTTVTPPSTEHGNTTPGTGANVVTTPEQVTPPAPVQMATSYTAAVTFDAAKVDHFKSLHAYKQDLPNGVMVTLPLGSEQESLNEIKVLWPDAEIKNTSKDIGLDLQTVQDHIAQLQADLAQYAKYPKPEQQEQEARINALKAQLADEQSARDALVSSLSVVTITLQAR